MLNSAATADKAEAAEASIRLASELGSKVFIA
jgi:hypothetical protein